MSEDRLGPPDADEVALVGRGIASAAWPDDGPTPLQATLLSALLVALTGHEVPDAELRRPLAPSGLAAAIGDRAEPFRMRIVQIAALVAMVRVPLPPEVPERMSSYASALRVDDDSLRLARGYANGSLGLAVIDFDRNGYRQHWDPAIAERELHTAAAVEEAWAFVEDDPALAARWAALAHLPAGTLGRRVWEFYRARGFTFPGRPGSAPPYLAQHDWVHVLADYGTTVESELEVFGLVSRATDDPRGFALLAMVVGLFEPGYVPTAAGLFEADTGHLARQGMATRLADAMLRGALAGPPGRAGGAWGDVRLLEVDSFSHADRPVEEVRRAFGIVPKSPRAVAAGSVGPWEPGGISPFQARAGQNLAAAEGRPYESYGAVVVP